MATDHASSSFWVDQDLSNPHLHPHAHHDEQQQQEPYTDAHHPTTSNNDDDTNADTDGGRILNLRFTKDDLNSTPENFSMVVNGVYRSSFPRPENFAFLERLKLKSIL